ncbi:uncharacterized protein LOC108113438 [Drosophila eugracilis]|uniref:uncharacterized protein LOC108113438 n=1 Tax=Drosophila eugracilis TaxID=29029 RepID=UPI0007E7FB1C|nr:uncharacterized protein LOC108113438 [Drosophila eugracilis]
MFRLSVLSGLARGVLRSSKNQRNILRCLSDSSDKTYIPSQSEHTKANLKKLDEEVDQSGHQLVWPNVKERNIHHYEEHQQDSNDDITASWGWKNNELDVEELAGLPGPSAEDPYVRFEEQSVEDQYSYTESDHSNIQEELQFERMRSMKKQLSQDLDSQENFTSFEQNSLTSVRENVDFMIQELSQISLLLNTLYPEESALVNNELGQVDNMGSVSSTPEMASLALNIPKRNENLDYEEEVISGISDQTDLETVDSSLASDKLEEIQLSEPKADVAESNQSVDPEINITMTVESELEDVESSENNQEQPKAAEKESEQSFAMTDQSGLKLEEGSLLTSETADLSEETATTEETMSSSDSQEESPSKTTESTPRPVVQPEETIHTYKPFRTIEIPASKPTSSKANEGIIAIDEMDSEGYTVSSKLTELESRELMRMALRQALDDLESGKNKYKATILEAETE